MYHIPHHHRPSSLSFYLPHLIIIFHLNYTVPGTVPYVLYPVRYGTQVPGYHPTVQTRSVIISHWVILDQVMRSPTGSSSQGSGVKIKLATVLLDVGL